MSVIEQAVNNHMNHDVVLGILVGFNQQHQPLVVFANSPQETAKVAMNTVATLSQTQVGKQVALLFVNGDLNQPIIMGLIRSPEEMKANTASSTSVATTTSHNQKHLKLDAEESIELTCGQSSLTLTRAGKILLRGQYVSSYSKGVNTVKGGSVKIN